MHKDAKFPLGALTLAISGTLSIGVAIAAPNPTGSDGAIANGGRVVISGNGFGTKSTASPAVWDQCSSAGLSSQWTGAWPNRSTDSNFNLKCRAPVRGVATPHSYTSMYMAGAHGENNGYDAGYNVMVFKARNITNYPAHSYMSFYQRFDPNWQFCSDNNAKTFDYAVGSEPYNLTENWYLEYNPQLSSATQQPFWHMNDNSTIKVLRQPDAAGNSWWWRQGVNPVGQWVKTEIEIRYARDDSGFVKVRENGVMRVDYRGPTDTYAVGTRTEAIGGYSRCSGYPNNWRYFADVYLDYTLSRVVFANAPTLDQATVIEPQPANSWSDGSITVTANLGRLASGTPIFAFVYDASGTPNSRGYELGSAPAAANEPPRPSAPNGLSIQ